MKITIAAFDTLGQNGGLLTAFFKARRAHFIGLKGWVLPENRGMEFDQYDTPFASYVLVHDGDHLYAGIRIIPTTAQCGAYSYMIRDAQLGLLPNMDTRLLDAEAPVTTDIWEATRGYVCNSLTGETRRLASYMLARGLGQAAQENRIDHYLAIVETRARRFMRMTGMQSEAIGPVFATTEENAVAIKFTVDLDILNTVNTSAQNKKHGDAELNCAH